MSISVSCQSCQRKLIAPIEAGGRTIKCPKCGTKIEVARRPNAAASQKSNSNSSEHSDGKQTQAINPIPDATNKGNVTSAPDQAEKTKTRSRRIVWVVGFTILLPIAAVSAFQMSMTNRERSTTTSNQGIREEKFAPDAESEETDLKVKKSEMKVSPSKGKDDKKGKAKKQPKSEGPSEAEAKAVLKTLLDAWVFGDSYKKFETDHPNIRPPASFIVQPKMLRYEIETSRKTNQGYEFALIAVFESKAGTEIKKGSKVLVERLSDEWLIMGVETPSQK